MWEILLWALLILFFLSCLYCTALFYIATIRFRRKPNPKDLELTYWKKYVHLIAAGNKWFADQNPERVEMASYDGLKLVGFYLPAKEPRCTILLMHGFRSDGFTDFSCALEYYHGLGCNILLVHQRAHGESEGKYICYGIKERFDCRDWINYIAKRFPMEKNIFISGISMGSATVLMASGLELPDNVRGIIADCGFTSPWEEFSYIVRRFHGPVRPFLDIMNFFSKRIAGFGYKEYSTLYAMKTNKIPVLFIHGEKDGFVPARFSRENYEACVAEKELIIVPEAIHGVSYLVDKPRCQEALSRFISTNLQ